MNKIWLVFALTAIMLGTASCSDDDDKVEEIDETDLIGTWETTAGKWDLSLEITSSTYSFVMSQPGKGGSTDSGTYEINKDGKIIFTNKSGDVLAMGYYKNEKLTLTFVNSIAIISLGAEYASNVVFTLSDDGSGDEDTGYLYLQNLSANYNIVSTKLYDASGEYLGSDTDVLEPDYQFEYETPVGSYTLEVKDSKGKTYKSKSFKIIKNKITVLGYDGSSLNVLATGINESDLTRSAANYPVSGHVKQIKGGRMLK